MDAQLCNRVLKFKTPDSKAGPRACSKQPKFVRLRSVTTQQIVLKFGDVEDIDVKLCNRLLKSKRSDLRLANGCAQNSTHFVWTIYL